MLNGTNGKIGAINEKRSLKNRDALLIKDHKAKNSVDTMYATESTYSTSVNVI